MKNSIANQRFYTHCSNGWSRRVIGFRRWQQRTTCFLPNAEKSKIFLNPDHNLLVFLGEQALFNYNLGKNKYMEKLKIENIWSGKARIKPQKNRAQKEKENKKARIKASHGKERYKSTIAFEHNYERNTPQLSSDLVHHLHEPAGNREILEELKRLRCTVKS